MRLTIEINLKRRLRQFTGDDSWILLQEMWFNNAHFEQKTLLGKMILSKVKRLKHEFEFRAILPNLVKFNF